MKNSVMPLIMSRIFNVPLMIHEPKLNVILVALKDRLGVDIPESEAENAPEKYKLSAESRRGNNEQRGTPDNVAIIPVHDTLVHRHTLMNSYSGMTSYLFIRSAFRKAMMSNDVAAVVLHFDSPGGEVAGVCELAQEIFEARGKKPIYAAVEGDAFSAAYYLASATDRIFITKSSGVGSVGVIGKHIDQSGYDEAQGLKITTFYAGARKNDFSPHNPLTEEALKVGLEMINYHYDLFVQAVARNRNVTEENVRGTEAALFWGINAIKVGFADEIGTLEDAIEAVLVASSAGGDVKNITKGVHPERKSKMDKFQTIGELVAAYPEFAAQLREEGRASVNIEEASASMVTAERDRVLGLAVIQFGAEAGDKFKEIVASGISVDQYQAVAAVNPPSAMESPEVKKMSEMLAIITAQTGKETPGMDTDPKIAAMPEGSDKWKAEYEKDAKLQGEFRKVEHYVAFKKGVAEGRVKIFRGEVK